MKVENPVTIGIRPRWRRLVPGLLISLVSLGIIFYLVDPGRFFEALRLADYRYVLLLFGITLIWLGVRSLVWRTLLREQASFSQVFLTLNEGYLLNNLLPFRLGEVARAFLLGKKAGLEFLQVFSTIIIERALDVVMAAALLLFTLPFVIQAGLAWQAALVISGLVLLGLILLHLLARNQPWALSQFSRLAERYAFVEKLLANQQLTAFFSGLDALVNWRRFIKVILLMIVNWGIAVIQFYVLLLAFFPQARLLWGAFTVSVMAFGIAAPSSPGAIGVMEVAIIGALAAFNLDRSTALAAALTAHLTNYLTTGVIGAFALAKDGLTLSGVFREVSQISPQAGPNAE